VQLSTSVLKRTVQRLITVSFPDAHAYAQWPGSPLGYRFPFHEPKPVFRSPWTLSGGIVPFRQLHLLRSFPPLANPFTSTKGFPSVDGRCSPGFLPL